LLSDRFLEGVDWMRLEDFGSRQEFLRCIAKRGDERGEKSEEMES
jgi:hypothetical protein